MSATAALARLGFEGAALPAGHVWLAGAGPGAVGHLTLEVLAALDAASDVVYDALVDPGVLRAANPAATLHFMGKRGGQVSAAQDAITARLIELARDNKRVLRLKGGDPFVFGRGGEEALALAQAGVPFRVLPGLTAALGALAGASIPATMRGVNKAVIFATGHGAEAGEPAAGETDREWARDWAALARTGQPLVIYMGIRNLAAITAALRAGGLAADTPAALLMAATTARERVLVADLGTLGARAQAEGFGAPALIVVGEIVAMRAALLGGMALAGEMALPGERG